jgi:hypothetical protein
MIDVDARLDQRPHGFDVSTFGGRNKRGAAEAVGAFEIGAVSEGHLQNFEMAARARVQVGAVVNIVLRIDVGASRDQRSRGLDIVAVGRDEKRSAALAVTPIEVHRL